MRLVPEQPVNARLSWQYQHAVSTGHYVRRPTIVVCSCGSTCLPVLRRACTHPEPFAAHACPLPNGYLGPPRKIADPALVASLVGDLGFPAATEDRCEHSPMQRALLFSRRLLSLRDAEQKPDLRYSRWWVKSIP